MALVEEAGAGAAADDPEALLNEWLGELTVLTAVSIFLLKNARVTKCAKNAKLNYKKTCLDIFTFSLKIQTGILLFPIIYTNFL